MKLRLCIICNKDISSKPKHHYMCYDCWKKNNSQYYTKTKKNYNNYKEKEENDNNIYYEEEKYSVRDALEGDEWAYYNLYGEMPDENNPDW